LSLQVHPAEEVAESLGGESKTEFWYVAAAEPGAEIYVGLRRTMAREQFEQALRSGTVAECVHAIPVKEGDAMFLPSGRFHAIGAGNVLIEVQQNSDTTYRVFDWSRVDDTGQPRSLHIAEALQCIDFNDVAPRLIEPEGGVLIRHDLFVVEKWNLESPARSCRSRPMRNRLLPRRFCDAVMLILPRDNSFSSQPQCPIARFIRGARGRRFCA
jgi:Phosphomannose isomerase